MNIFAPTDRRPRPPKPASRAPAAAGRGSRPDEPASAGPATAEGDGPGAATADAATGDAAAGVEIDPLGPDRVIRLETAFAALRSASDPRKFYARRANRAEIVAAAVAEAARAGATVLSLDVFDTALLRGPQCEARRFWSMAEAFSMRLEGAVPAEDIFLARALAADAGYAIGRPVEGAREGRLEGIARTVCGLIGRPGAADAFIETELGWERDSLTANALVADLAKALPELRIVFLSDMYIEGPRIARLIGELLRVKEPWVMSSADGHGAKRTGTLFRAAADALGVAPEEILHLGDSLTADYRMAKAAGAAALHLPLPDAETERRRACHAALAQSLAGRGIALDRHFRFNA